MVFFAIELTGVARTLYQRDGLTKLYTLFFAIAIHLTRC
jgi:hypothetical protein